MATDKKFAVAGVSTLEGKTKIRFANDTMRIKILAKNGHTNVELLELPSEMTKAEVVQHLKSVGFGQGDAAIEAAIAYAEKKNPAPVAVKATVAKTEAVVA
jgi:ribosome maturation protein Sdo1